MLRRQPLTPRRGTDRSIVVPPDKLGTIPVAAVAALAVLAAALRVAYAYRVGVAPPALALAASVVTVVTVGALASRAAGPLAGAMASLFLAALPAAVVASVSSSPRNTYALCAAAFSLLFYREGTGRAVGVADPLVAGAFAGAAVALSASALVLPGYYTLAGLYRVLRREHRGWASFSWLAGFAAFLAAAVVMVYARSGNFGAGSSHPLSAAAPLYPDTKSLLKRLIADAAAMLFWDARAFGATVVLALGATVLFLRRQRTRLLFYGGLLLFTLAAFNFFPTSWGRYTPMALEPGRWLFLALPVAVLGGGVVAELWSRAARASFERWAGALGGTFIAAALFINGNAPFALTKVFILTAAVLATFALAGVARRGRGPTGRRCARAAAALIVFVSLSPIIILYL